jgi:hypothetical protein
MSQAEPIAGAARAPSFRELLLNFLTFQAGWFACVLGAAHGRPELGVAAVALIAAGWLLAAPRPRALATLLLIAGIVGLCWDSWLTVFGLVAYQQAPLTPPLAPWWILALWVLLATTLHRSMRWLQSGLLLPALLGAVAAPLSYLAGARLGALTLVQQRPALLAQAAGWAVLLPALLRLTRRLNV